MGIPPEHPYHVRENAPDVVRGEAINLIVIEALRDALISIEEDDKNRAIKLIRKVVNFLQESTEKASNPEHLHNPDLTDEERESFMDALEELNRET